MSRFILLLDLMLGAGPLAADAPGTWEFHRNGLTIVVLEKAAEYAESRAYQLIVSNELRTLARLEVNRDGLVTDAWMTDLDGDGAFEIVVATAQLDGTEVGGVDIHEWRGFRFEASKAAELAAEQRTGYRGHDQFTVVDGRLRRAYPVFVERAGSVLPSGDMAHFEYRYGEGRWVEVVE